jgi:hypothetical protein
MIVPSKKLVIGYSPKVACTTLKTLVLNSLGHYPIGHKGIVHDQDMSTGKMGVFDECFFKKNDIDSFKNIYMIRDPYQRMISGVIQRSAKLIHPDGISDCSVTEFVDYVCNNNYGIDAHHFEPQTRILEPRIKIDKVYDMNHMQELIDKYFPGAKNKKHGGHAAKYDTRNDDYKNIPISKIRSVGTFSKNPKQWFSDGNAKLINKMYKCDFEFAKKNGLGYKMVH